MIQVKLKIITYIYIFPSPLGSATRHSQPNDAIENFQQQTVIHLLLDSHGNKL